MARRAGEVELHDQVVVIVVAAATGIFPAPGVQAVVPQMADMLAVDRLVGLREAQIGVAVGVVGELHGNEVARIDVHEVGLCVVAVARTGDEVPPELS